MKDGERSEKVSFVEAIFKHQQQMEKHNFLSDFRGLNQVLGNGFESSMFYLIYGSAQVMNSILLSMAVAAHLPTNKGGLNSSVVFIDNDNIFNPYSLIRLALSVNLDPNSVLARISVARAFIWNHLGEIVDNLEELLKSKKAKLVLISGLTTLFAGDFERKKHQMLMKIINKLRNIAIDNEIIIAASTQLAQGSAHKPAGGKILSHGPHVLIRVLQQRERITFHLVKHPSRPARQTVQWLSRPKRTPHTVPLDQFLKPSIGK